MATPMFTQGPRALQSASGEASQASVLPLKATSSSRFQAGPGTLSRCPGLESETLEIYLVLYSPAAELVLKPPKSFPLPSPSPRVRSLPVSTTCPQGIKSGYCHCSLQAQGLFIQLVVNPVRPGTHPSEQWGPHLAQGTSRDPRVQEPRRGVRDPRSLLGALLHCGRAGT